MTRRALPGQHYCIDHQGNTSHYEPQNCLVCQLEYRLKELEVERDNFRRVLEGMEFSNIDLIATEKRDTTIIGKEAQNRINELIKERDTLRDENVRLEGVVKEMLTADPRQLWNVAASELKSENNTLRTELEVEKANRIVVKEMLTADVGVLKVKLAKAEAENGHLQARLTEQADEFGRQIQSLHLDVAARDGEIERLREALKAVLGIGFTGEDAVDAMDIAKKALGGGE